MAFSRECAHSPAGHVWHFSADYRDYTQPFWLFFKTDSTCSITGAPSVLTSPSNLCSKVTFWRKLHLKFHLQPNPWHAYPPDQLIFLHSTYLLSTQLVVYFLRSFALGRKAGSCLCWSLIYPKHSKYLLNEWTHAWFSSLSLLSLRLNHCAWLA